MGGEPHLLDRDRGATLRLGGGGGAPLVTQYWGGDKTRFLYTNSL